jgi:hypothetical protein
MGYKLSLLCPFYFALLSIPSNVFRHHCYMYMLKQVVKCMCYLPVHTNYVFIILNKIKKLNKEATIKNTNVSYDFMYRTISKRIMKHSK